MDSLVQLAMIEKARQVFAHESNTFLSFPVLSPLTFSLATLAAVLRPQTSRDYAAAANFAKIANFIPRDTVATIDDDYLWEIYHDTLTRGVPASAVDDQVAESRLAAARELLYDADPGGNRVESEAYRRYRQCRDAVFACEEAYNARRLTTVSEGGVGEGDSELARLKGALENARTDWETIGQRSEVEAALAVQRAVAANNPARRWSEWQAAFNPDVDLISTYGPYAPTGYSPIDLHLETSWAKFELSAGEVVQLVAQAPVELRQRLASNAPMPRTSVSFLYRSVAVTRPWFQPDALISRIWRASTGQEPLNDGSEPPGGRCPAYVSALVLARRLSVQPEGTAVPSTIPGGVRFSLPPDLLTRRTIDADVMGARWRSRSAVLQGAPVAPQPVPATPPAAFQRIDRLGFKNAALLRRWPGHGDHWPGHGGHGWPHPTPPHVPPATPPQPVPPPPPAVEPDDSVFILAFICKRLPKTPDPLPELQW